MRGGYTLVEAVLVLMIAGLLASTVAPAVSTAQRRSSLSNAQAAAVLLSTRARAVATERGTLVVLEFDPQADRAWIRVGDDTLSDGRVDFARDYGTDLTTGEAGHVEVCYSSRGYALFSCSEEATLTFTFGSRSASAVVRPLGQIEKAAS